MTEPGQAVEVDVAAVVAEELAEHAPGTTVAGPESGGVQVIRVSLDLDAFRELLVALAATLDEGSHLRLDVFGGLIILDVTGSHLGAEAGRPVACPRRGHGRPDRARSARARGVLGAGAQRPQRVGLTLGSAPSRCAVKPCVERAATPERNTRLSIVSSGTRPSRPGIFALLLRAPALTIASTRVAPRLLVGRRARRRRAPPPTGPARRRPRAPSRHPGRCSATVRGRHPRRARCARATRSARAAGRRCCRRPARARPAATRADAGPASSATSSASRASHCASVVAARSSRLICGRGTLTNHTTSPVGSGWAPKNDRRPNTKCHACGVRSSPSRVPRVMPPKLVSPT